MNTGTRVTAAVIAACFAAVPTLTVTHLLTDAGHDRYCGYDYIYNYGYDRDAGYDRDTGHDHTRHDHSHEGHQGCLVCALIGNAVKSLTQTNTPQAAPTAFGGPHYDLTLSKSALSQTTPSTLVTQHIRLNN